MMELRNRQYMTIIDVVAGEDLEQGNVIALADHGDVFLRAFKASSSGDVNDVLGPLLAHWVNERSTSVSYSGGADGYTFNVAGANDADSIHYIPSGSRMLAIGGKGVAEVRLFRESLDTEFASSLPAPGTTLQFSTDEAKMCSAGNGSASSKDVAFVLENDGVSIAVLLG